MLGALKLANAYFSIAILTLALYILCTYDLHLHIFKISLGIAIDDRSNFFVGVVLELVTCLSHSNTLLIRAKKPRACTMYDFHNSTDTLKFWTEKQAIYKTFYCFSSDFDETWWHCSTQWVLQLHEVSSKLDEKQKSFINCLFFCSEFQGVSRIVKIVHSVSVY